MAQTLLGDGNVTATGRVSGGKVRAPSLADYEIGTDGSLSNLDTAFEAKAAQTPTFTEAETLANLAGSGEAQETMWGKVKKVITDFIAHLTDSSAHSALFSAKQDALATGLGISISQNYSYKWNTSNYGVLYTRSVPSAGQTATAYTNVGCTTASSYVDSIGYDGSSYVPVKSGSSATGTATLVGQTDDKVISTSAALSITANGVSTACTPDATTGQVNVSSLFSRDNTLLGKTIRYDLAEPEAVSGVYTLANETISTIELSDDGTTAATATITFPQKANGDTTARDFILRLDCSDCELAPTVTWSNAANIVTFDGDTWTSDMDTPDAEGIYLYTFTETTEGKFLATRKELTA